MNTLTKIKSEKEKEFKGSRFIQSRIYSFKKKERMKDWIRF